MDARLVSDSNRPYADAQSPAVENQGLAPPRRGALAVPRFRGTGRYKLLLTQMNDGAFRSREPAKAFFVDVADQPVEPLRGG